MKLFGQTFNAHEYAKNIFIEHTTAMISGCTTEFEKATELAEYIASEAAYILCDDLFNKKITPMEYNAVRNELTKLLDTIFKDDFEKEIMEECKRINNVA